MKLSDFDYDLPPERIARYPLDRREDSRMLVLDRSTKTFEDHTFLELPKYLKRGDVLVLNKTRVIPARLVGKRVTTGANIEIFLLRELHRDDNGVRWQVLAKPARKVVVGETYLFSDSLKCVADSVADEGIRTVMFAMPGDAFDRELASTGHTPLPPYLNREDEPSDRERYQTIFAEVPGAVAAPTAGLHFTDAMLVHLSNIGVEIVTIVLHTGLGTFRPVEVEQIEEHTMHEEYFEISDEAAVAIVRAKREGRRVIAVGTTSVRTLETAATDGELKAGSGWSKLFIHPPYRFQIADALITNFHMPKSTLLMMISALAGSEFVLEAYKHAVDSGYRFFSYGDAMMIL
jgi:S-adenosylmethionine:tRNA ribosyltransferase-isomerase